MPKPATVSIKLLERMMRADRRNKDKMRALNAVAILEQYEEFLRLLREGVIPLSPDENIAHAPHDRPRRCRQ